MKKELETTLDPAKNEEIRELFGEAEAERELTNHDYDDVMYATAGSYEIEREGKEFTGLTITVELPAGSTAELAFNRDDIVSGSAQEFLDGIGVHQEDLDTLPGTKLPVLYDGQHWFVLFYTEDERGSPQLLNDIRDSRMYTLKTHDNCMNGELFRTRLEPKFFGGGAFAAILSVLFLIALNTHLFVFSPIPSIAILLSGLILTAATLGALVIIDERGVGIQKRKMDVQRG